MSPSEKLQVAPRGVRNRNPLNIRFNKTVRWAGLADPPSDGAFCRFLTDQHGIRAAATLLRTYRKKYGLYSISALTARWAPPSENDSNAYATRVADYMGQTEDYSPNLDDPAEMELMLRGMCRVENGRGPLDGEWYPDLVWQAGVKMALEPLTQSRTMAGGAVAGAATAAQGLVTSMTDSITQAADVATTAGAVWPEIARWVLLVVALAGIGWAMYARWEARKEGVR
jgi:hypothetical protein